MILLHIPIKVYIGICDKIVVQSVTNNSNRILQITNFIFEIRDFESPIGLIVHNGYLFQRSIQANI
jgi:hypothetical protein